MPPLLPAVVASSALGEDGGLIWAARAVLTILCRSNRALPAKDSLTTKTLKCDSAPRGTLCLYDSLITSKCVGLKAASRFLIMAFSVDLPGADDAVELITEIIRERVDFASVSNGRPKQTRA